MKRQYLAVDLGAETGRVVLGGIDDSGVELHEIHRFSNAPVRTPDGLHWNVLRIFEELVHGLERALTDAGDTLVSIGVDAWGVDYGLFDRAGRLFGNPYHYRDNRTDGVSTAFAQRVSSAHQYARTGIAQMPINTLYQLVAQARDDSLLQHADALLMIPDIMHYWLTGVRVNEFTNASTTGALAVDGTWADDLIAAFGLPRRIFRDPIEPATVLGPTLGTLDLGPRARAVHVVVPATHDTACAVLAAPLHSASGGDACAFISSGTWSLLGLELAGPILTPAAQVAGFTNERGIAGSTRFLRNIMGLWLVQECRRAWRGTGDDLTYEHLTASAAAIASPGLIVDVDDPALLHPSNMPAAIRAQLVHSGQAADASPLALIRAIFEGLALQYRRSIDDAQRLAGVRVGAIAIVGGGARNALLCQLAADACERVVFAGPAEASATGNLLVQAVADRALSGLAEIRAFVRTTGQPRVFEPRGPGLIDWAARHATLMQLRAQRAQPESATMLERTSNV